MSDGDILAVFDWRQAVKRFDPEKKISEEDFAVILEAARLSPSSFGLEPWNLLVVDDATLREDLRQVAWGIGTKLTPAARLVVITAKTSEAMQPDGQYVRHILQDLRHLDDAGYEEYVKKWVEPWAKNDFGRFEGPQLLHEWAARQAYIVLANMMTVAAMRGVGSCPIEGFNIAKVVRLLQAARCLDPQQDLPVAMAVFGYRAEPQRPKIRRPMSEIVRQV